MAIHLQEQYSLGKSTIEGTAGGLSPKHWIWERGAPPQMPKILVSVSFWCVSAAGRVVKIKFIK